MKTAPLLVAAAVVLTSSFALADDDRHFAGCEHQHGHRAMPTAQAGGHYELQVTQQWVEGRYEQEFVAPVCRHRRHRQVCTSGFYRQVFRPGHYESVQQWVFVPDSQRPDYRRRRFERRAYGTPPPPVSPVVYGQLNHGAVSASVTFGRR